MNKFITSLALGAAITSASFAQQVVFSESFDYGSVADNGSLITAAANDFVNSPSIWAGNVLNTTVFNKATSLDGTGGAGFLDANSVYASLNNNQAMPSSALLSGAVSNFSFLLQTTAVASSGARIMFESAGSSSNAGYGINFNIAASGAITSFNRIGTFNNPTGTVTFDGLLPTLVTATFTRSGATAGDLTVSFYQGSGFTTLVGSQTSTAGSWTTVVGSPDPSVVLRLNGTAGSFTVDDINFSTSAVPEPSSFAALAGLAALGFVASRRRRA